LCLRGLIGQLKALSNIHLIGEERVVRRREVNPSQISRQIQILGMGGRYLQIFPRRYLQYLRTHHLSTITSVKAKRLLEFCHRPGNGRTWMIRNFPKGNESRRLKVGRCLPSPQAPTQPAQGGQIDGRHRPTFNLLDSLPLGTFLIIHVLPFPGLWQNSSNRFALTDVIVDRWWVRKYCKYLRGNICKYLPPIPNIWICLDICDGLTSLLRTTLSSPIK
jgi:hypothetical protein